MTDERKQILFERLEYLGANAQNKGGKSDKFYEVEVVCNGGSTYVETRRWGAFTTTKPQSKVLQHYSEWSAVDSARKVLAKKRAKGYTKPIAPLKRLASVMDDD